MEKRTKKIALRHHPNEVLAFVDELIARSSEHGLLKEALPYIEDIRTMCEIVAEATENVQYKGTVTLYGKKGAVKS